jgi:hypothetical protein
MLRIIVKQKCCPSSNRKHGQEMRPGALCGKCDVGIQTAGDVLTRMITSVVNTPKCRRYSRMRYSHVPYPPAPVPPSSTITNYSRGLVWRNAEQTNVSIWKGSLLTANR